MKFLLYFCVGWAGFDDTVASGHADRSPNAESGDRNCPKTMPKIVMSASDHGTNFAQVFTGEIDLLSPPPHTQTSGFFRSRNQIDPKHENFR